MWTQLRRAGALASSLVLIAGLLAAAPAALAVGSTASAVQISPPDINPKPVGRSTDLIALVTPTEATGTVDFYDDQDGARTLIDSAPVVTSPYVVGLRMATITLPADMAVGTYHIVAVYSGDDTYAESESSPLTFVAGPRPTTTTVVVSGPHDASGATAQKFDTLQVQVTVSDAGAYTPNAIPVTGTVHVKVDGSEVGFGNAPFDTVGVSTDSLTLGAHTITATFVPDDADYATSDSSSWPVTLLANGIEASGVGVQYATFYPYKDGYRDTDAIKGNRLETASVKIKITSPTGSTVKQVSIAPGTGPWSYAWNGRNSSGAMLAAGKYLVRQTVTDAHGAAKTYSSYITISSKRLYTYTVSLRKTASQITKNGGTWFGWTFTLPSATIYKKLVFSVYGKTGFPAGVFGPHSYGLCSSTTYWSWSSCMDPYASFPATASWASVTGNVTRNRHGSTVRMYAVGGYRTSVAYARVIVTYQVLK